MEKVIVTMLVTLAGPNQILEQDKKYEVNQETADAFVEAGIAKKDVVSEKSNEDDNGPLNEDGLKHLGGGWYELPNGEKVKGKEEALAALKIAND